MNCFCLSDGPHFVRDVVAISLSNTMFESDTACKPPTPSNNRVYTLRIHCEISMGFVVNIVNISKEYVDQTMLLGIH